MEAGLVIAKEPTVIDGHLLTPPAILYEKGRPPVVRLSNLSLAVCVTLSPSLRGTADGMLSTKDSINPKIFRPGLWLTTVSTEVVAAPIRKGLSKCLSSVANN